MNTAAELSPPIPTATDQRQKKKLIQDGPYLALDIWPYRQQHQQLIAGPGDFLVVVSLFILGGDVWDKLRALFVREAKAVFPAK